MGALTAANGYTANFIAIDFTRNSTTDTDYNLHRATANLTGYPDSSVFYNLSVYATNHKTANITLQNGTFLESCINYSTGNIVVNSNIECANISINVTGNLTILAGGNLTLKNVTINFSMTKDGGSRINKSKNGGLFIFDNDNNATTTEDASEIISNNSNWEYDFWVFGNSGNDNVTMQNSIVKDVGYFSTPERSEGIHLFNVSNAIISGNNISADSYGIYLQNSANNNITNNIITASITYSGRGIHLLANNFNNSILENTIITGSGSLSDGIYLWSSSSNNITGNTITPGSTNKGISINTYSSSNILQNNTIITVGDGIYLTSSSNFSTLQSNTITTSGSFGYGIYLQSGSNSNISSNTITTSNADSYGIYLSTSSNSNTLQNNTITTSGSSGYGIYLSVSSTSNISSNIITTNGSNGYGIYLTSSSNSNNL